MNSSEPDYAAMPEDEIDLIVGTALLRDTLGSKPLSDAEKRTIGKNWFRANLDVLARVICQERGVTNVIVGPEREARNVLFGSIIDAVMTGLGPSWSPVPIGALAAQVLHYGISQLCGKESESK
jgi:hypothetical protein